eukprot:1432575-Rhodomonas_salina.1
MLAPAPRNRTRVTQAGVTYMGCQDCRSLELISQGLRVRCAMSGPDPSSAADRCTWDGIPPLRS